MSYHFPSVQFNCHRGRKIVFPSSVFGRPGSGDFALTADRPSSSSATTPLLTPPPPEVHDSCLVMQQIYETDHSVCPTTYPTVSKDLEPKAEHAPLQTTPVLPFPVIDYFAYIAWDIMHGKIDTAFPSTLSLAINPLTPPPQAPTLQPESAFRDYVQRLVTTTAVSQSVVVVALYYLYQARARLQPQLVIGDIVDKRYGYSICAASLMLANKFLDDNTYTSRTWATLSGFTLWEINDCERGLLSALDLQLNISLPQYNDWWRFLTMYGPSFTYPFTSASAVPEMTRPMTAEATAPLMKASTRRVPHVDLLSRPGSRKRAYADVGVDSPNKRSFLDSQAYERSVPDSQPVMYQPQPCIAVQQPYAAPFAQDLQQPTSSASQFALDWSATIQDCPLGYYKLVASPADPRGDDHYRKAQLVQLPLQQQALVPRRCVPSMLQHSVLPPTYARPLSAPIEPTQQHGAAMAFQHPLEDYLSYYNTESVYSQQMPVAVSQHDAMSKYGTGLALHPASVYHDNTVDLTQVDGYYHAS